MGNRFAIILLIISLVTVGYLQAEETKEDWQPSPPPGMPDTFDWIQLKSGEWLKGEFIAMYDHELEFDSDELDDLTLDWEDIHQVRTARVVQILFQGHATATGKLFVEGDVVRILGEELQEFERDQVLTITSGGPGRANNWSGSVNIGANYRSGNTHQIESNAQVKIQRRTVINRITLDYIANFNETENVKVTNNHRVNLGWDKFLTRKFFINPIQGEYFRDPFQNIASRTTVGVGAGYQIFDSAKTDWEVSGGPAYQETRFETVLPTENESESTPAFTVATLFNRDLTGSIEFLYEYNFQITNEESGSYNHHMKMGFETEWTKLFDFDIFLVWDRIEDPQTEADLTVPEQDDFRLILSLGIDF